MLYSGFLRFSSHPFTSLESHPGQYISFDFQAPYASTGFDILGVFLGFYDLASFEEYSLGLLRAIPQILIAFDSCFFSQFNWGNVY